MKSRHLQRVMKWNAVTDDLLAFSNHVSGHSCQAHEGRQPFHLLAPSISWGLQDVCSKTQHELSGLQSKAHCFIAGFDPLTQCGKFRLYLVMSVAEQWDQEALFEEHISFPNSQQTIEWISLLLKNSHTILDFKQGEILVSDVLAFMVSSFLFWFRWTEW